MTTPRRPDPAQGLFETLLVLDGRPVELKAHMDRIAASLEAVFGAAVPADAERLVRERASCLPLGRVRLTVTPAGGELTHDAVATLVDPAILFPDWDRGAELRALPFPGGLGRHKWADRSVLPEAWGETCPLLLDQGGDVLEAGWANVFAVGDGSLMTPPADGRILPGIARAAAIDVARTAGIPVLERRLNRDDLFTADEVFLTGSVRGVEPARSLDGIAFAPTSELTRQVGEALRRRWSGKPAVEVALNLH